MTPWTPIMPTPRLFWIAFIGPALTVAVLLIDLDLWLVGPAFVSALVLLTVMDARSGLLARHLSVTVMPPDVLHVGEEGAVRVHLAAPHNRAPRDIELLVDVDDKIQPPSAVMVPLRADGLGEATVPLRPLRRGRGAVRMVWARWTGPFGLTWHVRTQPVSRDVPILPNLPAVRRAATRLDYRGSRAGGARPQSVRGAGSEFEALKDFAPGMDRRDIDWKRSARHRKLVCKEYKVEKNHNLVLAIDCGHTMREPIEALAKLDHAINAALIMAYQALLEGDRVGVFGFDEEPRLFAAPRAGRLAFPQLQDALASLDYSLRESNYMISMTRLLSRLRQPSIIVIMADFLDSVSAQLMVESVSLAARRHWILFAALADPAYQLAADRRPATVPDLVRAVVADDLDRERAEVLERLRRNRIDAFDVAPAQLDLALITRYAAAKERAGAPSR